MFSPDDKRITWPLKMESYHRQVVIRDSKNREIVIMSEWRPSIEAYKAKHDWAQKFVEWANKWHELDYGVDLIPLIIPSISTPEPQPVPVDPSGEKVFLNGDGNAPRRGRPKGSKNK